MKFTEVDLHPDLQEAIASAGFTEMTQIQADCIGPGLEGRDIAGVSQTGTGKTIAFLLPILHKILSEELPGPAALIVTPTRELCLQIADEANKLCGENKIGVVAIYGGEEYRRQEEALAKNPELIVATPGRLIDYVKQNKIDLSQIRFQVLDEADRMFDMGFIRDVRYIMNKVPENAQTMLFSATLSYYILRLASDFMKDPVEVRVEAESVAVDKIDQQLLHLGRQEKDPYLVNQLLEHDSIRAIVFTNYRSKVQHIERVLRRFGIAAAGISSLLDQKKRISLLKNFKLGKYQVLVATDVASRGLDVEDITHVYNYDLPQDSESYVHRIGRTARAGRSGTSISYCSEEDYENLPRIHRYLGTKIPVVDVDVKMIKFPEGEYKRFSDGTESKDEGRQKSEGRGRDRNESRDEGREGGRRRRGGRGGARRDSGEGRSRQPREDSNRDKAPADDEQISTEGLSIREQDRQAVLRGTRSTASGMTEEEYREGRSNHSGENRSGGGRNRNRNRNRNKNRDREGQENASEAGSEKGSGRSSGGNRNDRNNSGRDGESREGQGRRRRRRRGGQGGQGGRGEGGNNNGRGGENRGRRNNKQREAQPQKKKGILSKIAGLFKRG
ncbi:MAG: DEAD/DEAH box helicase [bacterium]|nr:DEAD/DEAH box helicase [bacterium]